MWAELYFPAISLYKAATVTCNFGPDFEFPPPADLKIRPCNELVGGPIESAPTQAMGGGSDCTSQAAADATEEGTAPDMSDSATELAMTEVAESNEEIGGLEAEEDDASPADHSILGPGCADLESVVSRQ